MDKFPNYSGMQFIPDNSYPIEDSQTSKNLSAKGIRTVEFVRAKDNDLLFIEAKSSFPNPNNMKANPQKGNKTNAELFRERVIEICDKFTHSLNVYTAIDVGVVNERFPVDFNPAEKVTLRFVLVINGLEQSWCSDIEKAITNHLNESVCMAKIWKPTIYVINHEIAKRRKLIK